jgi:nucleoid DNA-binding protein
MTKKELVKMIAEHRVATTPHKDLERHVRTLNKMTQRELELVAKGIK